MSEEQEQDQSFRAPLGVGELVLERKEALQLRSLVRSDPRYSTLRKVLEGFNEAGKTTLQDTSIGLDAIRVAQGRIEAVSDFVRILEQELDEWYDKGRESQEEND